MKSSIGSALTFASVLLGASVANAGSVQIDNIAPWPSSEHSLLLEGSEYFTDDDGNMFWNYLDSSLGVSFSSEENTFVRKVDDIYNRRSNKDEFPLKLAKSRLSALEYDVFRLALGARAYSPAIEAQRQLALSHSYVRELCESSLQGKNVSLEMWVEVSNTVDGTTGLTVAVCPVINEFGTLYFPPNIIENALKALETSEDTSFSVVSNTVTILTEEDHMFPAKNSQIASSAEHKPHVVLYGNLGYAESLSVSYQELRNLSWEGRVQGIFRHWFSPESGKYETFLSGYGAALDVKSTEYVVIDDRANDKKELEEKKDSKDLQEILQRRLSFDNTLFPLISSVSSNVLDSLSPSGPLFSAETSSKLAKKLPNVAQLSTIEPNRTAYYTISQQLSQYVIDGSCELNAVDSSSFGETSSNPLYNSASCDPLERLVEVTSNFPARARALSELPVSPELAQEGQLHARMVRPGTVLMTLNGFTVDVSSATFNFFSLLRLLKSETRLLAQLNTLPLPHGVRRRVLQLAEQGQSTASEGITRVDMTPLSSELPDQWPVAPIFESSSSNNVRAPSSALKISLPIYLNDVEKDEMYSGYSSSLDTLLTPTWQLHQVRRNLYSLVLVGDFLAEGSALLESSQTVFQLLQMALPIRIGLVSLPLQSEYRRSSSGSLAVMESSEARHVAVFGSGSVRKGKHVPEWGAAEKERAAATKATGTDFSLLLLGIGSFVGPEAEVLFFRNALATLLERRAAENEDSSVDSAQLTLADLVKGYGSAAQEASGAWSVGPYEVDAVRILQDLGGYMRRTVLASAVHYVDRLGVRAPSVLLNGRVSEGPDVQSTLQLLQSEMQMLQRLVHNGELDDSVSPSVDKIFTRNGATYYNQVQKRDYLLEQKVNKGIAGLGDSKPREKYRAVVPKDIGTILPRYSPLILGSSAEEQVFLPLADPMYARVLRAVHSVHAPSTEDLVKSVSLVIYDDLSSYTGVRALAALLGLVYSDSSAVKQLYTCENAVETMDEKCSTQSGYSLSHDSLSVLQSEAASTAAADVRIGLLHLAADAHSPSKPSNYHNNNFCVGDFLYVSAKPEVLGGVSLFSQERAPFLGAAVAASLAYMESASLSQLNYNVAVGFCGEDVMRGVLTLMEQSLGKYASIRPKAAATISQRLKEVFLTENKSQFTPEWKQLLLDASEDARSMILRSSPVSRTIQTLLIDPLDSVETVVSRVRGVAANGRFLPVSSPSLSLSSSSSVPTLCARAQEPSTGALSICPLLEDFSLMALAERGARGERVREIIDQSKVYPKFLSTFEDENKNVGMEEDIEIDSDYLSTVVAQASSVISIAAAASSEGTGYSSSSGGSSRASINMHYFPRTHSGFTTLSHRLRHAECLSLDDLRQSHREQLQRLGVADNLGRLDMDLFEDVTRDQRYKRTASGGSLNDLRLLERTARLLDAGAASELHEQLEKNAVGIHVALLVDPSAPDAQFASQIARLLRDRLGAVVEVLLLGAPRQQKADEEPPKLPVPTMFRWVDPPELSLEEDRVTLYVPTLPLLQKLALAAEEKSEVDAIALASKSNVVEGGVYTPFRIEDRNSRPRAVFAWLPPSALLTAKTLSPEPWNIQTYSSSFDTDNLRIQGSVHEQVDITYIVRNILLTGRCLDATSTAGVTSFPNGLQLVLHSLSSPSDTNITSSGAVDASGSVAVQIPSQEDSRIGDTLVMQNFGFFQLKSLPGHFLLSVAPGRMSELYSLVLPPHLLPNASLLDESSRESSKSAFFSLYSAGSRAFLNPAPPRMHSTARAQLVSVKTVAVGVTDFTGTPRTLLVKKNPGFENVPLLSTADADADTGSADKAEIGSGNGFFSQFKKALGFGSNSASVSTGVSSTKREESLSPDGRPIIHVFSIASGHVYERFLGIMMTSAVKRTPEARIHFWLVENFLSPQFKADAVALSDYLGCDVSFVSYGWPSFLRGQKEKQRLIWAYKILFLDVLFPLDVTKVIYVDADQILRNSLMELWNFDLEGAPYAYVPFCTSRQETLGFQFWREGYWKDHLRGKPYHISALYVVDLVKFRRMGAGDLLRGIYDSLSRDPNSLANLDQDLPNYAQHMVPIKSLPQEWLWCESWCSDDSKAQAKTIDLCNNPRFKEPKLEMAKRVISGNLFPESWVELDEEVRGVVQKSRNLNISIL